MIRYHKAFKWNTQFWMPMLLNSCVKNITLTSDSWNSICCKGRSFTKRIPPTRITPVPPLIRTPVMARAALHSCTERRPSVMCIAYIQSYSSSLGESNLPHSEDVWESIHSGQAKLFSLQERTTGKIPQVGLQWIGREPLLVFSLPICSVVAYLVELPNRLYQQWLQVLSVREDKQAHLLRLELIM